MSKRTVLKSLLVASVASFASVNAADENAEGTIIDQLFEEGKVDFDFRVRGEIVDESGKDATAITERIRLGFGTGDISGFSGYIGFTDTRALDRGEYAVPGETEGSSNSTIADPEVTDLDQMYLKYRGEYDFADVTAKVGRQQIILDNSRFIGEVAWRQTRQTYDAARYQMGLNDLVEIDYSYLWYVKNIFGNNATKPNLDSDSHLINLKLTAIEKVDITAFGYLLDFDNAASNSSNTYGISAKTSFDINESVKLCLDGTYAQQKDAGNNTTDYSADYYKIGAGLSFEVIKVGVGYEVLEGGAAAFQTPLATLHKFNGWTDQFLSTPAEGLEDMYVWVEGKLPLGLKAYGAYHQFDSESGSSDFGSEINIKLKKKFAKGWSTTFTFADADADSNKNFKDKTKYTLQADYKF